MVKFEEWLVANKEQINTAAYGLFEDSLRSLKQPRCGDSRSNILPMSGVR